MLNFIENNVNHFILIVFLYSTLYCYEKIYIMFFLFMPAPGISGVENVTDVDRWPPWRWLFMRPTLYRLGIIEH